MEIKLVISTYSLDDFNTDADNQRYADAVKVEIQAEYPEADVSVELSNNITAGSCWVSDDASGSIEENVNMIANRVWAKANY